MHSWLVTLLAGLAKSIFMSGFGSLRGKAQCKGSELQGWCAFPCTCSQLATRNVSTMILRGDHRSYNLCESQGGRGKSSGLAGCLGCRGRSCTSAGSCLFPVFHSLFCYLCSSVLSSRTAQGGGCVCPCGWLGMPQGAQSPRSLQVQGGGNISGCKSSQEKCLFVFLHFAKWLCPHVPHRQLGSGVLGPAMWQSSLGLWLWGVGALWDEWAAPSLPQMSLGLLTLCSPREEPSGCLTELCPHVIVTF